MKVLVIDDEHSIRHTLRRLLEAHGCEVVTANDGRHGMALFREEHPDLVITDIIMPEREGLETITAIRREDSSVKILAISGGGRVVNQDFLAVARKLGADAALAKPFDCAELIASLHSLLPVPPGPFDPIGRFPSAGMAAG